MNHFKNIHIGELIHNKVIEEDIDIDRICKFLESSESNILVMYKSRSLETDVLMKWCKMLDYDFFRIYTQHLILYSPVKAKTFKADKIKLPYFRKNIYTIEIIDFILEMLKTGKKTKRQIIDEYRIPKTTLYKWVNKYGSEN